MRAYSEDLRQRIVRAVHAGSARTTVAQQFAISLRTVDRYVRQERETGHLTPRRPPGRPRVLAPDHESRLHQQLSEQPAATLAEHCQQWAHTTGIVVSQATMSRAIARLGWTRKKGQWQPANATHRRVLPGGTT
jgi:transposase